MKFRTFSIAFLLVLACILVGGCAHGTVSKRTLLIYMCGSDLETKQGLAGKNIDELLAADIPADTRVIIETGGSKMWHSHNISNKKIQRYEVRNKQLQLLEEWDNTSMGNVKTLQDFLTWSTKNFSSQENVLVLWDHGGKSGNKICFDENFDNDPLEHDELTAAFRGAELPFKFDIVVYDACFMATLENAAMMSDYAKYLVASQEVIPSNGVDYKKLVEDMTTLDGQELGLSTCLAYLDKSEKKGNGNTAELSLIDLSRTDDMIRQLDNVCEKIISLFDVKNGTSQLASTSKYSAIYGAKSMSNLIDLYYFLSKTHELNPELNIDEAINAKEELVILGLSGPQSETMGISLYFPFEYDRSAFQTYLAHCPSKGYAKLLKRTFENLPARMLTLTDKGSISDDGNFTIALAKGGDRYLASITYTLYRQDPSNPNNYINMGSGCEVHYDWDNLRFSSHFQPVWPALFGQHLLTSIYLMAPLSVTYTAPVYVSGLESQVIMQYDYHNEYHDGSYTDFALWGGLDSNGVPSRTYTGLKAGDEVAACVATGPNRNNVVRGNPIRIPNDTSAEEANHVEDAPLEEGRYRYQFVVTDILGNNLTSDYGIFDVQGGQATLKEVQPQA